MRAMAWGIVWTIAAGAGAAEDAPLVQQYLNAGELARGEQRLQHELSDAPDDGQLRFSLAVIQLVRGVERLGQSLHEYGAKDSTTLFLRIPVPDNDHPAPINDYRFRRLLDEFGEQLEQVESTLSKVSQDDVRLPLLLADIRLDLDADGQPESRFGDILSKLFRGRRFDFMKDNPLMKVVFDRGDVAWLRAYCHLMMGIVDVMLACDTEPEFERWTQQHFANPQALSEETRKRLQDRRDSQSAVLKEPARLGRFRRHILAVVDLNHETWKHIRAETDNDHEWLPNPKQTGVLGLPVRDQQIDNWLAMMSELRRLFEGERTLPQFFGTDNQDRELNLKTLFDDPPEKMHYGGDFPKNLGEKYFTEPKPLNLGAFFAVLQMFSDPGLVGYPVWFN